MYLPIRRSNKLNTRKYVKLFLGAKLIEAPKLLVFQIFKD